ncbi:ATP-binding cassette sub-family G member 1 [Halotydeus destructor]|nr:ATP-binding cassette sub-family G member 1 [Halotydeus destructor]
MGTTKQLDLSWRNLSYTLPGGGRSQRSTILSSQSGHIVAGTLTAIMGPSGAGKTTLVNCLLGNIKHGRVGGEVLTSAETKQVKIRCVPQSNSVLEQFTVFENLIFASKVHFRSLSLEEHSEKVKTVVKELDLESAIDTVTHRLSGGQWKRLAIGLEIISEPDILILDEPTTGLDSATAIMCVNLLKTLAKNKSMAVMAIIHQPSNEVFLTFDMLYLLSNHGQRLYFGPPDQLLPLLSTKDIVCSNKYSIPEFAIKVANSGLKDVLVAMEASDSTLDENHNNNGGHTVNTKTEVPSFSLRHVGLLFERGFVSLNLRTPFLVILLVFHVVSSLMVAFATPKKSGSYDGCQFELNDTLSMNQIKEEYTKQIEAHNTLRVFIISPITYMLLMSTIMSSIRFPLEYNSIRRELDNSWYSASSYITAKLIGGVFECCITSPVYVVLLFYFSDQNVDTWRTISWLSIITLSAIYYWLLGFLYGLVFKHDVAKSVLSSVVTFFTFSISKIFVDPKQMSSLFRLLLPLNFFDLAVSAVASVMYGFGRCPLPPTGAVSLYEALAESRSPFSIISKSYQDINFTKADISRYAPLVDIDENVLLSLKESVDNFFATQPEPNTTDVASYILEHLGVHHDGRECWMPIGMMFLHIAVIIIINYMILIRTAK